MRVEVVKRLLPASSQEYKAYQQASPLFYLSKDHLSKDDPPFLLIHGDADQVVAFKNSEVMEQALKQAGVEVKLLRIPGGNHGPDFPGATAPPDYMGEMVHWFNQHLQSK
jgi:dipeptidyl aminopeptidase/acylaminoacyl peptidase